MAVMHDEYVRWKNSPVYEDFVREVKIAMTDAANEILGRTTSNPDRDSYLRGFLQGLAALDNYHPDFVKGDEEND